MHTCIPPTSRGLRYAASLDWSLCALHPSAHSCARCERRLGTQSAIRIVPVQALALQGSPRSLAMVSAARHGPAGLCRQQMETCPSAQGISTTPMVRSCHTAYTFTPMFLKSGMAAQPMKELITPSSNCGCGVHRTHRRARFLGDLQFMHQHGTTYCRETYVWVSRLSRCRTNLRISAKLWRFILSSCNHTALLKLPFSDKCRARDAISHGKSDSDMHNLSGTKMR